MNSVRTVVERHLREKHGESWGNPIVAALYIDFFTQNCFFEKNNSKKSNFLECPILCKTHYLF